MKIQNWRKLVFAEVLCLGTGVLGSVFTANSVVSWYPTINKPSWNPPAWVFGPVWTTLFLMMGVAFYRLLIKKQTKKTMEAINVFSVQLGLNILWSILFFGIKSPWLAFVEIVVLWVAIWISLRRFWAIDRVAGWLMFPYLAWVSFASLLNLTVALINK